MGYVFNGEMPIYLQIIEHIKTQIISKKYLPKQKLPSVRDLSFEFEVNPNTVQKALQELEDIGLIFTERTNGKFVTDNEALIEKIKNQTVQQMVDDFYTRMAKIGIGQDEVSKIVLDRGNK